MARLLILLAVMVAPSETLPCRPPPTWRRTVIASAASIFLAPRAAQAAASVRQGMSAFSAGKVDESVKIFDTIFAEQPQSRPYLWQRGLSLYYAERFEEGAKQFATDVSVNPNDTEETIWNFMCVARTEGFDAARKNMLKVGVDPRPVMRTALELFRGDADESRLQSLAKMSAGDEFYAKLYLGLYREAQGDADGARRFITEAAASPYGKRSGDYMADLARVHVKQRGW